jgi:hypothetical protein
MKTRTLFRISSIILLSIFLMGQTSCVVFYKKDNGKHKGWFKGPKKSKGPLHPSSTNPGHSKGKGKGHSKGKGR